jgi:hypothetical protein
MKTKQSGVALVEFALVLPLLLLITLITTEFGRALYQYNTLAKSVRDSVRYLSVQTPGTKIDEAKNLVVFGSLSNTGTPLAFGLAKDKIPDPIWQANGASPVINTVTIKIAGCANSPPPCYKFVPLMSSIFGVNFGTVNFADIKATMRSPS